MGKATATSLYSASDHRSQYSIFPETKGKKKTSKELLFWQAVK